MRNRFLLAVAVILALLPGNLAWGQANLPNNPNAATVQGPDPTGMLGYPLATVPATGALPWPVAYPQTSTSQVVTSATAPNSSLVFPVSGYGSVAVNVSLSVGITGNYIPVFEGSNDGGATWGPILASVTQTFQNIYFRVYGSGNSGTSELLQARVPALTHFRVRHFIVLTGGTATVTVTGSGATFPGPFAQSVTAPALNELSAQPILALGVTYPSQADFSAPSILLQSNDGIGTSVSGVWNDSVAYVFRGDGTFERSRTVVVFKAAATAAAGDTALWTPTAGKKFRLMRWRYTITGSATTAGGADILVKLFDGAAGVTGQQDTVTVPAAATTLQGQLATSPWIDLGNGYLSSAANNVLNINLSAALSAGTVTVEAVGTEE